jgi:hypothetical protein
MGRAKKDPDELVARGVRHRSTQTDRSDRLQIFLAPVLVVIGFAASGECARRTPRPSHRRRSG